MTTEITTTDKIWVYLNRDIDRIRMQMDIEKMQEELYSTDLYKSILQKKEQLRELEAFINNAKQIIKDEMIENNVDEIVIHWHKIKIKTSSWALVINDESVIPEKYMKTKEVKSPDKILIKKDLEKGLILPWVKIEKSKTLEIKKL